MTKQRRKKKDAESSKSTNEKATIAEEFDLARKHRPQTIDDIRGNAVLKKQIKAVIKKKQIPNCVMLYGPHGCGKTTIARILAKELNCSDLDLKEIDVAHFNGIATARQLRSTMKTKPMKGGVKVWILDEVALLGRGGASEKNEAQSALLKALEEPPKHCYFFLCTTDPQNVLNTIKSRCIQYSVSTLAPKQIVDMLNEIADKEGVTLPKKVGMQIARDCLGHARDALKIMQRIMHMEEEEMLSSAAEEAEKRQEAIRLIRAFGQKTSWKKIAEIVKGLTEKPETLRRGIRTYYKNVLLNGGEWAYIVLDVFKQPYYNTDAENEFVKCVYECWQELQE